MSERMENRRASADNDVGQPESGVRDELSDCQPSVFFYQASPQRSEASPGYSYELAVVPRADGRVKVQVACRDPAGTLWSYKDVVFGSDHLEVRSRVHHVGRQYSHKRLGYRHYKNKFVEGARTTPKPEQPPRSLRDMLAYYIDEDSLAELMSRLKPPGS